ncbi:MAG: 4Fe-4S dicluster domain-containing protein [Chlorobiaceae bacterium]|jgi:anaerobic sulfite reductase subunit C|nr:4Fe-4S dicluster domain-containing protein [Chlorobiaceae bacterium]NTV16327.1 4Fe-4S dicluster domain-containing protein [Chlorobiaceae bacterium]
MAELETGLVAVSGVIRQKQPEYHVLRLKAVAGDLSASQLACIAVVAEQYGSGFVHLSTRQGVEIHNVHRDHIDDARVALQAAGVEMGASGTRVRVIVACPGEATCKWGAFDTRKIAIELDKRFFNQEAPSKFKMAVTGCANNCTKANENDIGIKGAIEPEWVSSSCCDCGLCLKFCPAKAIERKESGSNGTRVYDYSIDREGCINCNICTQLCPGEAWVIGRQGYTFFIGGTMGKIPRFATVLKKLVESEEELYDLTRKALTCFRNNGRKKERFGHMIDRIGIEKVREEILGTS